MNKYIGPIKGLGGSAVIAFIIAVIVSALLPSLGDDARNSVLVNAVPFFAIFVGILLLFILCIALVAIRYNGKIPPRTYGRVELTIIAGILSGVVFLFQPFSFVPYRYGFLLLLFSTLLFILWSHVLGGSRQLELKLPKIGMVPNVVAGIAAVIIVVLIVAGGSSANAPVPPYGVRERVFNSYSEERKAEIAAEATASFTQVELPFLVVFGLFPALLVFFIVRETLADTRPQIVAAAAPAASGAD